MAIIEDTQRGYVVCVSVRPPPKAGEPLTRRLAGYVAFFLGEGTTYAYRHRCSPQLL
jgi:hypothetical protein